MQALQFGAKVNICTTNSLNMRNHDTQIKPAEANKSSYFLGQEMNLGLTTKEFVIRKTSLTWCMVGQF